MPIEIQQLVVEPMPADLRPEATAPTAEPSGSRPANDLERSITTSMRANAVRCLRLRAD